LKIVATYDFNGGKAAVHQKYAAEFVHQCVTNKYMTCERLIKPAIKKSEIKEIILGGGQNLLSPERRFDAILFNSQGLFS
jgi:hypothetical protein